MKIGYVVGVFDLLHYGHKNLINYAMNHSNKLIIGIHTDEFVISYKRKPIENEIDRKTNVTNYIKEKFNNYDLNNIVLIDDDHKSLIDKYNINVIYHGDDWEEESYKKQIKYYETGMDKLNIELVFINYSLGISTSDIINNKIKYLNNYTAFLFDLDNTLILNNKAMQYSNDLFDKLHKYNKEIYVISNNNYHTPLDIFNILKKNNLDVNPDNVITSLSLIKNYLLKHNYKSIYVWGSLSSKKYLSSFGLNINNSDKYDIVVVLYNNNFNYTNLVDLMNTIKYCNYIIGNIDPTYPDKNNLLPDTGSMWKLIEYASNKSPIEIFGKPNTIMIEDIFKKHKKSQTVMIGDSKITDMKLAENGDIDFIHLCHKNVKEAYSNSVLHLGVICDYLK